VISAWQRSNSYGGNMLMSLVVLLPLPLLHQPAATLQWSQQFY